MNYVVADLFDWQGNSHYDVVFFSFWLSHVPRSRFGEFWSLVASWLTPSGRAFLIDNRNDPQPRTPVKDPFVIQYDTDLHLRRLRDSSSTGSLSVMCTSRVSCSRSSRQRAGRLRSRRRDGSFSVQSVEAESDCPYRRDGRHVGDSRLPEHRSEILARSS